MCSGPNASASSMVDSHIVSVNCDNPKIRSMLTLSKPPALRRRNASREPAASWRRFIHRRIPSSNDCTPMLTRFTPSARNPATYSTPLATMSSGFTSTVNSLYVAGPNARTIRSSTASGNTDGVPPPIYSESGDVCSSCCREVPPSVPGTGVLETVPPSAT